MASKTSADTSPDWPGRTVQHEACALPLSARRAALGRPEMPRNAGNCRTDSKRALLAAIEKIGGRW
ncbi:MAG TPA: hypothetical protein VF592_08140 [Sphingomonas sp.]|jgi:hypothetical protein|uniref:hypothetical protein n=1 Tax=Sphingomonas sp. TaxID=28214 RepID=UPI002ED9786B